MPVNTGVLEYLGVVSMIKRWYYILRKEKELVPLRSAADKAIKSGLEAGSSFRK